MEISTKPTTKATNNGNGHKAASVFSELPITGSNTIPAEFNLTASDIGSRGESFCNEKALRLANIRRVSDVGALEMLGSSFRERPGAEYHGLAIPIYYPFDDPKYITLYTLRRDKPDKEMNGANIVKEKRKYLRSAGSKNALYIPPFLSKAKLTDKSKGRVFVIVEGEFKALVLARVATNDFTSDKWDFLPMGLSGVYNFRTKRKVTEENGNQLELSGGLLELDHLKLDKKDLVFVMYDSDVDENKAVARARAACVKFFREKGARVKTINTPKSYDGKPAKGIDDFLGLVEQSDGAAAAIDAMRELINEAKKPEKKKQPAASSFYIVKDGESEQSGVYYIDDISNSVRICAPLDVIAETSDERGENCGRLLKWRDSENRLHNWSMPIEAVYSDGGELVKFLASCGLDIAPSRANRERIAQYIQTAGTEKKITSANKIGWHGESFVLPDVTIGEDADGVIYQTDYAGTHNFDTAGTLEDWKENISKYCVGNSMLLFAVSHPFAAPLLPLIQTKGGGSHLRGSSSSGKSTAIYAAGSVCGGGGENGFLHTWRATSNGLEGIAAAHNHALLCLDEMGQCEARDIGNVIYMLANGESKIRMTRGLRTHTPISWNLLYLSTGEVSLSDKIIETGGRVRGGQEVRLCDIEADTGKYGVFDDLHGFDGGRELSDHLRSASCKFYGTAFRAFLGWLVEIDRSDILKKWYEFHSAFLAKVGEGKPILGEEAGRVASRFALIAFGGELATMANITGWNKGDAEKAAQAVFKNWLDGRGGTGQTDANNVIRQVRKFIEQHGSSRFQNVGNPDERVIDRAGFIRKNEAHEITEFLILTEVFKTEVARGFNWKFAAHVLTNAGYLESAENKSAYISKGFGNMRVFTLSPHILEDADGEEDESKSQSA